MDKLKKKEETPACSKCGATISSLIEKPLFDCPDCGEMGVVVTKRGLAAGAVLVCLLLVLGLLVL
jgi:predicted RNA-binding Zn-ribbon protein involved in translation (DUF1610 family)